MTDVLVTHSYFLCLDPKQQKLSKPYPPLATLIAVSALKEWGKTVSFFDVQFCHSPAEIEKKLDEEQPGVFLICDDGFNYLTKMCLTNMREAAFRMIDAAKKRNCLVIISSSDATDHYEKYFHHGADIVIAGETEETLKELMEKISDKTSWTNIRGIIYRENGSTVKNEGRPVLKNLDSLPLPAWELVDFNSYEMSWKRQGYFSVNIATTRGCPFKCNWCAKPIYGNRYNVRSPLNVVREIEKLSDLVSFQHIWFCDDIFGLKPGWVIEFSDLLEETKIKIRYKIQSRADLLLEEGTIEALARSGCDEVWIGAESGSQKILDTMDKGITVEQIKKATHLLKKHGIKPCFFIQFGYLGENNSDIEATLTMVEELQPHDIGVSVSYPLPGTLFYEKVKNEMGTKANWTDSDELAMMFSSSFHTDFYKSLHRYIHKKFRTSQGKRFFRGEKQFLKQGLLMPYYYFASFVYRKKMQQHKTTIN